MRSVRQQNSLTVASPCDEGKAFDTAEASVRNCRSRGGERSKRRWPA